MLNICIEEVKNGYIIKTGSSKVGPCSVLIPSYVEHNINGLVERVKLLAEEELENDIPS